MGGNMLELAAKEVEKDKRAKTAQAAVSAATAKAKPTDVMATHVKAPRATPTEKATAATMAGLLEAVDEEKNEDKEERLEAIDAFANQYFFTCSQVRHGGALLLLLLLLLRLRRLLLLLRRRRRWRLRQPTATLREPRPTRR